MAGKNLGSYFVSGRVLRKRRLRKEDPTDIEDWETDNFEEWKMKTP